MEFINQVRQLNKQTKSPEVKQICESYLNGDLKVSDETVKSLLGEHLQDTTTSLNVQNYREAVKKEEMQTSKRIAQSLMESWGTVEVKSLSNSGSYITQNSVEPNQKSLLESLESIPHNSDARAFVEAQGLKNFGILESINTIKGSSIHDYPAVRVMCEKYLGLIQTKGVPEFLLVNNFVAEASQFKWDSTVSRIVENLSEKSELYSREIEVSVVLEKIKASGSSSFYSELSETLNSWLISEEKSSSLLAKNISKWSFNPVVRGLVNYLNLNESKGSKKLEVPVVSQGESRVERIYSPVLVESDSTIFAIGNTLFEMSEYDFRKISQNEFSKISKDYLNLVSILNNGSVKINESGVFVRFGKKTVRLVEENDTISVYLDRSKLNFNSLGQLGKILSLETGTYLGVNESKTINNIIDLYRNYNDIVELDFAKSIVSNIYEGVSINLIKLNGKIYLHRINEAMRENSLFQVNGTQAVNAVKDLLRYDISEGLTEFLEGEQKIKSVMVNDRNKVLENISKVETEINKLESLVESNPLYSESKEIKHAHSLLSKELSSLKEKWNQINLEISKIDSGTYQKIDLLEDSSFNIGDYIKVKESGETGKIISADGTSGRFTVLLDSGRTTDVLVNEIVDLDQALKQAGQKNAEESNDDDSEEEMKESKNLEVNESKAKTSNPSWVKAPGDSKLVKGKELNPKDSLEVAPGDDKKAKGKVEGEKHLSKAPGNQADTDFEGNDGVENDYEIGYNLREKEEGGLAEAPEKGKEAAETKARTSAIGTKQNLATAPGKSSKSAGDSLSDDQDLSDAPGEGNGVDFDIDDNHGYNIQESDELKKN